MKAILLTDLDSLKAGKSNIRRIKSFAMKQVINPYIAWILIASGILSAGAVESDNYTQGAMFAGIGILAFILWKKGGAK